MTTDTDSPILDRQGHRLVRPDGRPAGGYTARRSLSTETHWMARFWWERVDVVNANTLDVGDTFLFHPTDDTPLTVEVVWTPMPDHLQHSKRDDQQDGVIIANGHAHPTRMLRPVYIPSGENAAADLLGRSDDTTGGDR